MRTITPDVELPEFMIDIEALGLTPGSAIIQIGAVSFIPSTGEIIDEFEVDVSPQAPFTADLETLAWHQEKGTWPRPEHVEENSLAIGLALYELGKWIGRAPEYIRFWSWGGTYDFPLLAHAYSFAGEHCPWRYYQAKCARTVWDLTFPGIRHAPRPHRALEDARMAVADLTSARQKLSTAP